MSTDTRDRLNDLARTLGHNVEDTITFLLDEQWKAQCIADADRSREQDPAAWRADLTASAAQDHWSATA